MATITRLVQRERLERDDHFSSHSGAVQIFVTEARDRSRTWGVILASSPTTSHFNNFADGSAVPNGWLLIDTSNGLVYVKTGASTWTKVGTQT